ncbi:MAG TPA: SpoIIE family protein phosphatase [Solirubrobacteraceae bacterium]|nr:SpoIIE family protein phosphatase [Solirubrobacteraceae bacterium]
MLLTAVGQVSPNPQQARELYRLSDPALSELGLDELLDEMLIRVRSALGVDTVAILLLDEESQQLVARAAKGIEEEVDRGVRIPIGRGFAGRIAAERLPIFIADVDHADVLNPVLREKGISSLLGVPLIVEGALLGVIHVGSLRPRTFGPGDLGILQLAAARVAPAIERARLFSALAHEHRVAVVLQRSLLPTRLPEVVGVSIAARYLPARDEVGGDWYDVIELPRGLLGIVIGDVVGHGIRAAALMGQLRTALHGYALEGHPPGYTLELVDRFAQGMPEPAMATAAYAQFDPETGVLRYATAGHLPPIILSPQETRSVELVPGTPLGAFAYSRCPEHELRLNAGETLVLYTDGLVERRDTLLSDSIENLIETIREGETPEDVCLLAIDRLMRIGPGRDDAAIVALQNTAIPGELRLRLSAEPRALTEVRQALRRWLSERGIAGDAWREITIAVGEACANAIEHAYSPAPASFELEATTDGDWVTVTVRDTGRWREPRGRNRGRGLTIMRAAMDDVDVSSTAEGTVISMRRRLSAR